MLTWPRMPVTKGDSELAGDLAGRGYRIGLGTLYPARTKARELFGEPIEGE